ncbi:MAG: SDR family oxidoreductase [Vicinamibacterales bacterium]
MPSRNALSGHVALVAGATRGAGRGIACALGDAGATVYCSGRSTREHPCSTGFYAGRPETIEETAEMVTARGGKGIAVRTDHLDPEQVQSLVTRIEKDHKRLDVLVNDISEGDRHDWQSFWKVDVEKGFTLLRNALHTHIITCRFAVPLMVRRRRGLVVEIGDGDRLQYRGTLFYDLIKTSVTRLGWAMAEELRPHGISALTVTPGFMRTEVMLDAFGVTESNWREGARKDPSFVHSETPLYVGRAVAALAADPNVLAKSGGLYSSWGLAREYGFTDVDGSQPDIGTHLGHLFDAPTRTGVKWTTAYEGSRGSGGSRASKRR